MKILGAGGRRWGLGRGMMKLMIYFGAITKLDYFLGVFLKVEIQNWNRVANFQLFLGVCLEFMKFYFDN